MKKGLCCSIVIGIVALSTQAFAYDPEVKNVTFLRDFPPEVDTLRFDIGRDLADQLISLDSIYKVALSNSPLLRSEEAAMRAHEEQFHWTKYAIFDGIKPFATYLDGNQTLYLTSGAFIGDNFQLTTGYRYGITAEIPLSELFGRKHKVKAARYEYLAAQARRQGMDRDVKIQVMNAYLDLIKFQKILNSRLQDEQSQLTALRIAEVELREGKISPEIFSRISGSYTVANISVETVRGDFLKSFYTLEIVTGVSMQDLKK
jgi:outer membrane protein TolC